MRKELGKLAVCAAIISLSISPVLAQGRGNGNGNAGGKGNAGAGVNVGVGAGGLGGMGASGNARASGNSGGQSDLNISGQGRANGNGANATNRAPGADRASVRSDSTASTSARANAANELGKLNAVNASANARQHASSKSTVGAIATYETNMRAALALTDTTRRNAAITTARQSLAQRANKRLTASAIQRIDSSLNIQGASPQLGAQ